jgi:hypothetical protein
MSKGTPKSKITVDFDFVPTRQPSLSGNDKHDHHNIIIYFYKKYQELSRDGRLGEFFSSAK